MWVLVEQGEHKILLLIYIPFLLQGFGMTETCGIVSLENATVGIRNTGSAGMLVSGVESQIVSVDNLKPLPPNQLGEIWVRGPNMMQGISFFVWASDLVVAYLVLFTWIYFLLRTSLGSLIWTESQVGHHRLNQPILIVQHHECVN